MKALTSALLYLILSSQTSVNDCKLQTSSTRCLGSGCSDEGFSLLQRQVIRHEGKRLDSDSTAEALSEDRSRLTALQSVAAEMQGFWANPVALGLMLGLLLIGPDHLGTLMALSTLTTGFSSFKVGFAWGLGHSVGMIMICPIFLFLREVSAKHWNVSLESWEHYGDYIIGASMVFIAVYFVLSESTYLEKQEDGTYVAKACSCHATHEEHQASAADDDESSTKFCAKYCQTGPCKPFNCTASRGKKDRAAFTGEETVPHLHPDGQPQDQDQETAPLVPKLEPEAAGDRGGWAAGLWRRLVAFRDVQGAALGALQGLCCPMGIAGLGFMGRITASASPLMLLLFAAVFVSASAFGSGLITLGWGSLSSRGMGRCMSPRIMYHSSCVVTFLLGVSWILCNFAGVLHHINFAEKIHQKIHELHTYDALTTGVPS